MPVYTCAVQRKQIWPDGSVVWAARDERVNVIGWAGEPFDLGQMLLEKFLEENKTGIAPDGFRAVVWAGDRRGENLNGSVDALAVVEAPVEAARSAREPRRSAARRRWGWFRGRAAPDAE
ncbi:MULTISPECIES: hypothetical protein [Streptomyces]|uniref:Uncharacterized protein n=1 Tax=Streptomyces flaveolus TaxID=67297 RepID=A0ABV3AMI3_9ACTN|nr:MULTISPECIES: hypothetical protein [Streptomyces]